MTVLLEPTKSVYVISDSHELFAEILMHLFDHLHRLGKIHRAAGDVTEYTKFTQT